MSNQIIFESTESVIEVLWDIALAVFVFRLALIYVATTLASFGLLFWTGHSFLLGWIEHLHVTSDITTIAVALPAIVLPLVCARTVVALSEVPRVPLFRLAIGGTSLVLTALIGMIAAIALPASAQNVLHGKAIELFGTNYTAHTVAAIYGLSLASLALMPFLSMVYLEGSGSRPATDWTPEEAPSEKTGLSEVPVEDSPATQSTRKSHPMIPAN